MKPSAVPMNPHSSPYGAKFMLCCVLFWYKIAFVRVPSKSFQKAPDFMAFSRLIGVVNLLFLRISSQLLGSFSNRKPKELNRSLALFKKTGIKTK